MRRQAITIAEVALGGSLVLLAAGACDNCAGTLNCETQPNVSYTGHFVVRTTGANVPGVRVAFARRKGIGLATDTIRAVSDARGFFVLRSDAAANGTVTGDLLVEPPLPYKAFAIPNIQLESRDTRGDGGVLGRLVVDPFLMLLGELHNPATDSVIRGASIVIRTNAPTILSPDSVVLSSDTIGRFFWEPNVLSYGPIDARFAVRLKGDTTVLHVKRSILPQHVDGNVLFVYLGVGRSIRYAALVSRRGTDEYLPGTTVQFTRTSGVAITPADTTMAVDPYGSIYLTYDPVDSGVVIGTLTVRPPAPFATEVINGFTMKVRDDDQFTVLGRLGYGPGALIRATFLQRASGAFLAEGTRVRFIPVSGLPIIRRKRPGGRDDDLIRQVNDSALVAESFATADTGQIVLDIEVQLPAPQKWDTLRAVTLPSRLSDVPTVFIFLVGPP